MPRVSFLRGVAWGVAIIAGMALIGWCNAFAAGDSFRARDVLAEQCWSAVVASTQSQCVAAESAGDWMMYRDASQVNCQCGATTGTTGRAAVLAVLTGGARHQCPVGASYLDASSCLCDGELVPRLEDGVLACAEPDAVGGSAVDGGVLSVEGLSEVRTQLLCEVAGGASESIAPCVSRGEVHYRPVMVDATVLDADANETLSPLEAEFSPEVGAGFLATSFSVILALYFISLKAGVIWEIAKRAGRA